MRCSSAGYRCFFFSFSLHSNRVSGCFTSFNLDELELYSNHTSQNNMELDGNEQEEVSFTAVDQDLQSVCDPSR